MEQYKKEICTLNENPNFINTLTKERERILMHNTALELAYEDGEEEGRKEQQLDIVRNLITIGLSDKEICTSTGLTMEELMKLKNAE